MAYIEDSLRRDKTHKVRARLIIAGFLIIVCSHVLRYQFAIAVAKWGPLLSFCSMVASTCIALRAKHVSDEKRNASMKWLFGYTAVILVYVLLL